MVSQPLPQPGAIIDGKYRVERLVAEGGMGIVILATQLHLDRPVAIKFLRASARQADGVLEQFEREAKLAAQIKSEHVVRVHDVGMLPAIGPYMVMEYLEGENLAGLLRNGLMPLPQAIDYILQACDALAEVHALDIVHRDLKPENLFLAKRPPHAPIVKLIDFGISKAAPKRGQTGEWSSEAVGTPSYMAPEQLEVGPGVDARADIWALGVVLYELLTGVRPFEGAHLPELCNNILTQPPVPPSRLRPDVPPPVEQALLRCLEKDPARRVGSVLELATLLGPFARAQASDRVERVALASRRRDGGRHAPTMLVARKKSGWMPFALGLCAVLAVSGLALVLLSLRAVPKKSIASAVPLPPAEESAAVASPETATSLPASVSAEPEPPASPSTTTARTAPPRRPVPHPAPRASQDPRANFGERR